MRFPALHNAAWPGLVGKGPGTPEPCIDLDTMISLTAGADVEGKKFDGIDLFLALPHVDIDSKEDDLKRLVEKLQKNGLKTGSFVAPIWGHPLIGSADDRAAYLAVVEKACRIAQTLQKLGVRSDGVVRVDSACSTFDWAKDPVGNTKKIVDGFRAAADIAADMGERLAAEGEICWGGMQSWKMMRDVLESVDRPKTFGMQVDLAHTMLYLMGYNAPEDRLLPIDFQWGEKGIFQSAYRKLVAALKPWVFDFHVAQNDGTVKGQGSHDKTGRHCLPTDPNGKLDITWCAKQWLQDDNGAPTRAVRHLCWDGCMFTNDIMAKKETWNSILTAMLKVQNVCGWDE